MLSIDSTWIDFWSKKHTYTFSSRNLDYELSGPVVDVSQSTALSSDHQLARMLQIGMVLEEVVEARAIKHHENIDPSELDSEIEDLLAEAAEESAEHRERLKQLVDELDAEPIEYSEIEQLVVDRYESDTDFDGILYDQLCSEETAYKFYDDLINAIQNSDATFSIGRTRLLAVLRAIREEEKEGAEAVTALMEDRA